MANCLCGKYCAVSWNVQNKRGIWSRRRTAVNVQLVEYLNRHIAVNGIMWRAICSHKDYVFRCEFTFSSGRSNPGSGIHANNLFDVCFVFVVVAKRRGEWDSFVVDTDCRTNPTTNHTLSTAADDRFKRIIMFSGELITLLVLLRFGCIIETGNLNFVIASFHWLSYGRTANYKQQTN